MAKKKTAQVQKKPLKAKATMVDVQSRVNEIADLLLKNTSRQEIEAFAKKKWKVGSDTISFYVEKARKMLYDANVAKIQERLKFHIDERWDLYKKLVASEKTIHMALTTLQDMAKLEGLYACATKPVQTYEEASNLSTGVSKSLAEFVEKLELGKISKNSFKELCKVLGLPNERIEAILSAVKEVEDTIVGYDKTTLIKKQYLTAEDNTTDPENTDTV